MDLSRTAARLMILLFLRHLPGILGMGLSGALGKLRESLLKFSVDDGKLFK